VGQQSPSTTDIGNSNTLPTCSTPCGLKKPRNRQRVQQSLRPC
jgi:hypothetical protein